MHTPSAGHTPTHRAGVVFHSKWKQRELKGYGIPSDEVELMSYRESTDGDQLYYSDEFQ